MNQVLQLKKTIGRRVRFARKMAEMTQEELAASVGRSTEAISNIERGISIPPIETLLAIASALNISLTSFFSEQDEARSRRRIDIETQIQLKVAAMDDDQAELALRLISAIDN